MYEQYVTEAGSWNRKPKTGSTPEPAKSCRRSQLGCFGNQLTRNVLALVLVNAIVAADVLMDDEISNLSSPLYGGPQQP